MSNVCRLDRTSDFSIASKCDDISCSEVIRALRLDDDPVLEEIEARIEQYADETKVFKKKKAAAEGILKGACHSRFWVFWYSFSYTDIDAQLKDARAQLRDYDAHKSALEKGEPFESQLTSKANKSKVKKVNGKKRKNGRGGKKGSPKRRRSDAFEDDDLMVSDEDDHIESDIDSESDEDDNVDSDMDSDVESDEDEDESSKSGSDSDSDSNDGDEDEGEEVTVDSLKVKIDEVKVVIKNARERLSEVRNEKKDAVDTLASLKKNQVKVQREKNAFCSLKRSEVRNPCQYSYILRLKHLRSFRATC